MLTSMKIIFQFKSFEICEQKIYTKMSNLNNGILALDTVKCALSGRGSSLGSNHCVILPFLASGLVTSSLTLKDFSAYLHNLPVSILRASPDGILAGRSLNTSFTPPVPRSLVHQEMPALCWSWLELYFYHLGLKMSWKKNTDAKLSPSYHQRKMQFQTFHST